MNISAYEELQKNNDLAMLGGGKIKIESQHCRGKFTARERINKFLDQGSFQEFDRFVLHDCHDFSMEKQQVLGDGVVTGFGKVNGRLLAIYAQDFTVIGGSLSKMHASKICKIMDLAITNLIPIVGINDSGGARIQEGIDSLSGYGEIFSRNVKASGLIPQISIILGPCAGGAVYSPAIQDFVIMNKENSYMFVTGPKVVKDVIHEDITTDALGGAKVHSTKSGLAHLVSEDEEEALLYAKKLLSYLPSNTHGLAPEYKYKGKKNNGNNKTDLNFIFEDSNNINRDLSNKNTVDLCSILPDDNSHSYDMHLILTGVLDEDSFFELQSEFGKSCITGFGLLNGQSVGIVANQPNFLAGVLDINSSDKIARFVRTCDSFNIPIITFEDVPGFMPGAIQEHGGIIRHGAKVLYAYAEATVPKLTFIIRKAYGGAYIVMNSRSLGADYVAAWPNSEIAVMGAAGASDIIFKKEAEQKRHPEKFLHEQRKIYSETFLNPYKAANKGYIDEVIDPNDTRYKAINILTLLKRKKLYNINKKHGNIPL